MAGRGRPALSCVKLCPFVGFATNPPPRGDVYHTSLHANTVTCSIVTVVQLSPRSYIGNARSKLQNVVRSHHSRLEYMSSSSPSILLLFTGSSLTSIPGPMECALEPEDLLAGNTWITTTTVSHIGLWRNINYFDQVRTHPRLRPP